MNKRNALGDLIFGIAVAINEAERVRILNFKQADEERPLVVREELETLVLCGVCDLLMGKGDVAYRRDGEVVCPTCKENA